MVKVGKCALIGLMHKKWTLRVELTKKTSHCKSRDFLRKRRLKTSDCNSRTFLLYKIYKMPTKKNLKQNSAQQQLPSSIYVDFLEYQFS